VTRKRSRAAREARPPRDRADEPLGFGGVAPLALWVGGLARLAGGNWVSVAIVFAALAVVGEELFIGRNRGPAFLVAMRLRLASYAIWSLLGCLWVLTVPIGDVGQSVARMSRAEASIPMIGYMTAPFQHAGLGALVRWAAKLTGRRLVATVMTLAVVATLGLVALVGVAITKARHAPEPDRYVASLPVVARQIDDSQIVPDVVRGIRLGIVCDPPLCEVTLQPPGRPATKVQTILSATGRVVVRDDAAHGYFVLDATGGDPKKGRPAFVNLETLSDDRVLVTSWTVAEAASPPVVWIAGGAVGIVASLLVLARAAAGWARRPRGADLAEGILDRDHVVTLAEGAVARLAKGLRPPRPGPVVVSLEPLAEAATAEGAPEEHGYRDGAAGPRRVRAIYAGTLATLEDDAKLRAGAESALALAIATLAGTPLVASAIVGLLRHA
jgi:hypothetical protein